MKRKWNKKNKKQFFIKRKKTKKNFHFFFTTFLPFNSFSFLLLNFRFLKISLVKKSQKKKNSFFIANLAEDFFSLQCFFFNYVFFSFQTFIVYWWFHWGNKKRALKIFPSNRLIIYLLEFFFLLFIYCFKLSFNARSILFVCTFAVFFF